jgi:hypothetical protein
MKLRTIATKLVFLFFSFLTPALLFAQDGGAKVDVDIHKDNGGAWYTNPVVWIIGAAVFILLLVALLRGGNNSSRT